MEKLTKKVWLISMLVLSFLALLVDLTGGKVSKEGKLQRAEEIQDEYSVQLEVDADGILEGYDYEVVVLPRQLTEQEAEQCIEEVKKEIDKAFLYYEKSLPIQTSYLSERVEAKWSYTPGGYVDSSGNVIQENVPKEGILIMVQVELICGKYEETYIFPIQIEKYVLTEEEEFIAALDEFFEDQMSREGVSEVLLPAEINDVAINWKEKKEYVSVKVLCLELIAVLAILYLRKKEKEKMQEERRRQLEIRYSDVVSQFAMLLETGMTMRQAWQNIARQYQEKKKKGITDTVLVYEMIVRMARKLSEGEKERVVYESFIKEINIPCYRRLMRTLIGNLEKGMAGISVYLEEEERRAYSERILQAKKLGEEASTKMLAPLMIMMILVMGIVLIPALIGFLN